MGKVFFSRPGLDLIEDNRLQEVCAVCLSRGPPPATLSIQSKNLQLILGPGKFPELASSLSVCTHTAWPSPDL